MCLCERGKFATQVLLSVQVMALGSTNREVNMSAGEVLFLKRACCIMSSDCHMCRRRITKFWFSNLLFFFCAHHAGTNQAPRATVSTYRKHKRTAFNRPCIERQSSCSSSTFVSTRVRQRKEASMKEQATSVAESHMIRSALCLFFSSLNVSSVRKGPY